MADEIVLMHEGKVIRHAETMEICQDEEALKEAELENKMADIMENANQVFVLMSALNIDRVVTVYKAANKVKRIMLQDVYMSLVTDLCGNNIPNPCTFNNVYAFTSKGMDEEEYSKYFCRLWQ